MKVPIVIIGNGDVQNRRDGLEKAKATGVEGIMIGRGIFHDFFGFSENDGWEKVSIQERLKILQEHVGLFEATWGGKKNFALLKKFFKIYISGFDGASDMRVRFMETQSPKETITLVENLLSSSN